MSESFEGLLFDDRPIVAKWKISLALGLEAAAVIQEIHYWLLENERRNINFRDGYYWTYNSVTSWRRDHFPYIESEKILRAIFLRLEKSGILVSANYNSDKRDRTKWYRIDYSVLEGFVQATLARKAAEDAAIELDVSDPATTDTPENPESCIFPNGKMHLPERENASAQTEKCIRPNGKMHLSEKENAFAPEGKPLPVDKQTGLTDGHISTVSENVLSGLEDNLRLQVELESFASGHPEQEVLARALAGFVVQTADDMRRIAASGKPVEVSGVPVPPERIMAAIDRLRRKHLEYIFARLENFTQAKNKAPYMRAMIYNSVWEAELPQAAGTTIGTPADSRARDIPASRVRPTRFANFKQRDWDFDAIELAERRYLQDCITAEKA